jgi:hypothetical protein
MKFSRDVSSFARSGQTAPEHKSNVVRKFTFALMVLVGFAGCRPSGSERYVPQQGDLIFQSLSHDELGRVIEHATRSPLSHCGILVWEDGEWQVLEAIGPVTRTPWAQWKRRGKDNGILVCRLKPEFAHHVEPMIRAAEHFLGRPYDFRYQWDDEHIYCSELIWKAYHAVSGRKLGEKQPLRELDWEPNAVFIEKLEGGPVPLDREMITPVAVARAADVEVVFAENLQLQNPGR